MDPKYGELSQAMRNRTVELYVQADSNTPLVEDIAPAFHPYESNSFRYRNFLRPVKEMHDRVDNLDSAISAVIADQLSCHDIQFLRQFATQNLGLAIPAQLQEVTGICIQKLQNSIGGHSINFPGASFRSLTTLHPLHNSALINLSAEKSQLFFDLAGIWDVFRRSFTIENAVQTITSTIQKQLRTAKSIMSSISQAMEFPLSNAKVLLTVMNSPVVLPEVCC